MDKILIVDLDSIPEIYEIKEDSQLLYADPTLTSEGTTWRIARANRRTLYNYMSRASMSNANQKCINFFLEKLDQQQGMINDQNEAIKDLGKEVEDMDDAINDLDDATNELQRETGNLITGQNKIFFNSRYSYIVNTVKSLIKDCVALFFEALPAIDYTKVDLPQFGGQETVQLIKLLPIRYNLQDEVSGNAVYGFGTNAAGVVSFTISSLIDDTIQTNTPNDLTNVFFGTLSEPRMNTMSFMKNNLEVNPFGFGRLNIPSYTTKGLTIQKYPFTVMIGFRMSDLDSYLTANPVLVTAFTFPNAVDKLNTSNEVGVFIYLSSNHPTNKKITMTIRHEKAGINYSKSMNIITPTDYAFDDFIIFNTSFDYNMKASIPLLVSFSSYNSSNSNFVFNEYNMGVLPKDLRKFADNVTAFLGDERVRLMVPGPVEGRNFDFTHFGLFDASMNREEMKNIIKVLFDENL